MLVRLFGTFSLVTNTSFCSFLGTLDPMMFAVSDSWLELGRGLF